MRAGPEIRRGLAALAFAAASITGCALGGGLPPVVAYMAPADGSGSVPVASTITATFSRAMDASTINASSFIVQQGDTAVAGTVTCSGRTATFAPAAPLTADTLYTATITAAAKDTFGAAVPSARAWSFTTLRSTATDPYVTAYAYTPFFVATPANNIWTRSMVPVSVTPNAGNTISQSFNPADGSVTLTVSSAPGYEDDGFYVYVGTLQYFSTLKVVGAAGTGAYSANIYLDVDNDGQFFTWDSLNRLVTVGADAYYGGPSSASDLLSIDSTSVFGPYTLAQIKAGAVPGTSPSTRAAIWIGFSLNAGSQTTQIMSVKVNQ